MSTITKVSTGYSRSTTKSTSWSTLVPADNSSGGGAGKTTSWTTAVSYATAKNTAISRNTSRGTSRNTVEECVVEGTLIHIAQGAQRPIEDLIVGNQVLTMDGTFNVDSVDDLTYIQEEEIYQNNLSNEHTAVAIWKSNVIGTISINDGQLRTTMGHIHIIKRDGLWIAKTADTLEVGDVMFKLGYGEFLIDSLEVDEVNQYTVYKLDVEPNDTFFANGILTHNRKGEVLCSAEDRCTRGHPCEDRFYPC